MIESYKIGSDTATAIHDILAANINKKDFYPRAMRILKSLQDYYTFFYCLWPQIKYSISLSTSREMIGNLKNHDLYPVEKPYKGPSHNPFGVTPLLILWYLSRIKYVWYGLVEIKWFLSKLHINK